MSTPVSDNTIEINLSLVSAGPWIVLDMRPARECLTISCSSGVVCRIENQVSGKPITDEDVANAYAISQLPLLLSKINQSAKPN